MRSGIIELGKSGKKKFSLPLESVTQTFGLLAIRGAGKTYTMTKMAEGMLELKQQVVILDPTGVCHGLRSSADGRRAGFNIPVFGGEHGDLPLEPDAGKTIADAIVRERIPAVLSLSHLRKGESRRFAADFLETVFHLKNRSEFRTPMHLMLDEADEFAPQQVRNDVARLVGAAEDVVRRGRSRGLGVTMATQRPAAINKNVLSQISVLVAMRLMGPHDLKALDEWIVANATERKRGDFAKSLSSLQVGEAWFWSPGWLNIFEKVKIGAKKTFDTSGTPEVGKKQKIAKVAEIDIPGLRKRLEATIDKAKRDDPKELKKRIAQLEREAKGKVDHSATKRAEAAEARVRDLEAENASLKSHMSAVRGKIGEVWEDIKRLENGLGTRRYNPNGLTPPSKPATPGPARFASEPDDSSGSLTSAQKKILTVIAQAGGILERKTVAAMSGFSNKSSGFSNNLSSMRTAGYMIGSSTLSLTSEGEAALGTYDPLPTGLELIEYWKGVGGKAGLSKAARNIITVVAEHHPEPVGKEALAEESGYSIRSSGFSNALSELRTRMLMEGSDMLSIPEAIF